MLPISLCFVAYKNRCNAAMQQAPSLGTQTTRRYLAQFVVAEVISIPTLFAHDAPLPQFIQTTHYGIFVASAGFYGTRSQAS
jgi:hypothetical protein